MQWRQQSAVFLLACTLHGCGSGPHLSFAASQAMAKVKVGMPREDVIVLLGQPIKQQVFGKTEVLTYQPDWSLANAWNFNPIAIEGGKVSGLGLTYATKVEVEFKAKGK